VLYSCKDAIKICSVAKVPMRRKRAKVKDPADGLSVEVVNGSPVVSMPEKKPDPVPEPQPIVEVKKKVGRPKITLDNFSQSKIKEVYRLARLGMSLRTIAGAVGTSVGKLIELREQNEDFSARLDAEREHFIADNLTKLRNHAQSSPQSAQWLLERVRPEEFSQKTELRVSGGTTNTLSLDVSSSICQRLSEARLQTIDVTPLTDAPPPLPQLPDTQQ
jgi:hypothetical protein